MIKHLVWLMMAVAAIGGCRSKEPAQYHSPVGPLPAGSFAREWTAKLNLKNDPVRVLPLIPDRVLAYTRSNLSYVIGRASGELQFIDDVNVSGGVLREPIVLGDYLIYPTSSSLEIHNFRGRLLKSIPLIGPTSASGVGSGNMVYIGINQLAGYGRVVAMNITRNTSVPRWSVLTRGSISGRPALFEKTIYVGSEDGNLVALTEDGTASWVGLPGHVFATRGSFMSDIHADETGVYASNTDSKLYVLEPKSGKILWQFYSGAPLKTAPRVTGTMVYQFVTGKGVAALDKHAGAFNREPKWIVRDAVQFLSEDEGHAYLRRRDNALMAIDKQTGKVLFTSKGNPFSVFATNLTSATIYAATTDGQVVGIRAVHNPGETGELVGRFEEMPLGG